MKIWWSPSAALASENPPIDPGDFNAPTSKLVDRVARVDVEYQKRISTVMTTTARLYADAYDQRLLLESSRAPVCMVADGTCRLDLRTEAQWGGSELQARFDWLRNGTFVTMVGGEAAVRHARTILDIRDLATGAATTPSTGIIDRGVPQLSTYGQQTWSPLRWLDLNAGVRVDYDPRFEGVVSPREAIRVTPWSGGTFKLIHSQAYRAPTFRESFMNNALQPLAEDLRPETVRSFEGVFQQAFGGQRLRLSVFQSTWKNLIDLAQLSSQESAAFVASGKSTVPPLYQYRNLKEVDTRGFELSWEGSLLRSRLQHAMNVTSTLSDTEDNHPLDGSPRLFGNARVSYALGGGLPTLGLATTFYTRTAAAGTFDAPYTTPYYAPAQLVTRVVVAGQVPHISRLTYRGYVSYAAADRLPLTVGPAIAAPPLRSAPLLSPVDRFTTLIGLAYEF